MIVAYHTGSPPSRIREAWSVEEIETFLASVPFARRFGHPLFRGED